MIILKRDYIERTVPIIFSKLIFHSVKLIDSMQNVML